MHFRLRTAFITATLMWNGSYSQAQTKPNPNLAPRCDLMALNKFYISRLNEAHQRVNPTAPPVRFDRGLMEGTLFHNRRLERLDTIFHASCAENLAAEICLSLSPAETRDPLKLAEYVFARFSASSHHSSIQMDLDYVWVCASCTDNYCVIRLSGIRTLPAKK